MQDAAKVINFIKSRALYTHSFANLCDEMESELTALLLHCEIRWLSKSKALKRLLMLKNEAVSNDSWLLKLCYLAYLFEKLNEINLSLQGESTNVFTLKSTIK